MNDLLKYSLILAGGAVSIYAIRSYGYQNEIKGYKEGVMVTAAAYEKNWIKKKRITKTTKPK